MCRICSQATSNSVADTQHQAVKDENWAVLLYFYLIRERSKCMKQFSFSLLNNRNRFGTGKYWFHFILFRHELFCCCFYCCWLFLTLASQPVSLIFTPMGSRLKRFVILTICLSWKISYFFFVCMAAVLFCAICSKLGAHNTINLLCQWYPKYSWFTLCN